MAESRRSAPGTPGRPVVVVTGAASGIGRALALALNQDWPVVASDLPARAGELEAMGEQHGVLPVTADVGDPGQVERLFEAALAHGPLHGAVNCAGIGQLGYLSETTPEMFDKLVNVHFKGTFLVIRAAYLALRRLGRPGSIVTVSSINGAIGLPGQAVYSAAKAAANSLVGAAAVEGGPYGVRVNAIAPGSTRTAMNPHAGEGDEGRVLIPMRRAGFPADMVGPVRFLLSEESAYVTGCVLSVDGGLMHMRGGFSYDRTGPSGGREGPERPGNQPSRSGQGRASKG